MIFQATSLDGKTFEFDLLDTNMHFKADGVTYIDDIPVLTNSIKLLSK